MGWTKHNEDDCKIYQDRIFMRHAYTMEVETRAACKAPVPRPAQTDCEQHTQEQAAEDIYIVCKDCGSRFCFSVSAQRHYEQKGWRSPKRCKQCRDHRYALRNLRQTY